MIFRRLTRPVSFSGAGLHSGVSGMVTVVPGTEGYRVTLRTEKEAFPIEKCRFTGTGRGTEVFLPDGSSLKTPEHLFSALSGLGIWSAAISAEGPEVPALDGCAAAFASALEEASRPLGPDENLPEFAAVSVPAAVQDGSRRGVICAFPDDELHISSVIDYKRNLSGPSLSTTGPQRMISGSFLHLHGHLPSAPRSGRCWKGALQKAAASRTRWSSGKRM